MSNCHDFNWSSKNWILFFLTFLSNDSFALPVIFLNVTVAVAAILPKLLLISYLLTLSMPRSVHYSITLNSHFQQKGIVQNFLESFFLTKFLTIVITRDKILPRHIMSFCSQTFDAYVISDSHKTTFLSYSLIQLSRLSDIFFVFEWFITSVHRWRSPSNFTTV